MPYPEHLTAAITRGAVPALGDACEFCLESDPGVEAVVTLDVAEDGEQGTVPADRDVCLDCVWHMIRDEHRGDGAPRVLLHPGVPIPPGIRP